MEENEDIFSKRQASIRSGPLNPVIGLLERYELPSRVYGGA